MKQNFYNIVKGTFLVSDDSLKNWRFILFLSLLALVMIGSSHTVDKKVHRIGELSTEVKALKSESTDMRITSMREKMESTVTASMELRGLKPSETPPQKIKIISKK